MTRILQTDSKTSSHADPVFRTVEIAKSVTGIILSVILNLIFKSYLGTRLLVTASKEVILSAGSIGTPQLLQLSGIGDHTELSKLGIHLTINLPSVGKNLSEQPLLTGSYITNTSDPLSKCVHPTLNTKFIHTHVIFSVNGNATLLAEVLKQWEQNRMGPLVDGGPNQVSLMRLPKNSPIFEQFPDPAAGPNTPHLELRLTVRATTEVIMDRTLI